MACNTEPPPAQEKYLKLTEEPDERGIWWLDERVRRQMEASLDMDPQHLTFTVYQARPLRLTRAEVRQVGVYAIDLLCGKMQKLDCRNEPLRSGEPE